MSLKARTAEAASLLETIARQHASSALASSFGAEDMVLVDLVARGRHPDRVFTHRHGRLPRETLVLVERVRAT
jgi:phosphoadenosine phosphosulfate reductase